ncbi:MAG TPA: hypothetical protein VM686_07060, partial [Polyangiaceae bacterium]|nr:hypothetical protein [Polyangiaceae bacterium]
MGQEVSVVGRARRCEKHGLASGPDGMCALCRRGSVPAPRPRGRWVGGAVLFSLLLAAAGALAYRSITRPPVAAEPARAAELTAETAPPSLSDEPAPEPATEAPPEHPPPA